MANIAIISKTPDSHLPENNPTPIFQWQNCAIFGGNIRVSARLAKKTKPQQPFGCAVLFLSRSVTQQSLHKNRNAAIASDISPCLGC